MKQSYRQLHLPVRPCISADVLYDEIMQYLLFLLVLLGMPAHAQEDWRVTATSVDVSRIGAGRRPLFRIQASTMVRATPQQVWRVLTDYARLPEFVPELLASDVISRTGNEAVVEQHGRAGFLFVSHSIRMRVHIQEQPYSSIDVRLLSGDMRHYSGHWTLAPFVQDGIEGTHIRYSGMIEPNFFVLPLIGTAIVQANVKTMMEAVAVEIERRSEH